MFKPLLKMAEAAEGDYLSPEHLATLDAYYQSVNLRAQTYRAVQRMEQELLAEVNRSLRAACARQPGSYDESKCLRDTAEVLRQCSLAMLLDDRDYLYDHFLHWMRTIMVSIDHLPIHRQVYPALQAAVRQKLAPTEADLLVDYLTYAQSVMR